MVPHHRGYVRGQRGHRPRRRPRHAAPVRHGRPAGQLPAAAPLSADGRGLRAGVRSARHQLADGARHAEERHRQAQGKEGGGRRGGGEHAGEAVPVRVALLQQQR